MPHSPTQNSRYNVFKICFSQDRMDGESYDLLHNIKIQSENVKMT